jgi:zinc D-Ala-D-Ala dipeptidase
MRRFLALLLVASGIACAPASAARQAAAVAPPVNTVETAVAPDAVADTLLTDVRSLDPAIVVDLRYATSNNFTGAPLPGYSANRAYLRREAAAALAHVERDLRSEGLGLKIFDAYRPVRATLAMVDWTERVNRPDLLKDGYIASRSRHNLGLAIDLTLIDLASGRELEMGTPFDTFSAAAHTANATGVAATNRQKLKAAMEREGFVNYDQEWWHFSFGVPNPLRFDRPIR